MALAPLHESRILLPNSDSRVERPPVFIVASGQNIPIDSDSPLVHVNAALQAHLAADFAGIADRIVSGSTIATNVHVEQALGIPLSDLGPILALTGTEILPESYLHLGAPSIRVDLVASRPGVTERRRMQFGDYSYLQNVTQFKQQTAAQQTVHGLTVDYPRGTNLEQQLHGLNLGNDPFCAHQITVQACVTGNVGRASDPSLYRHAPLTLAHDGHQVVVHETLTAQTDAFKADARSSIHLAQPVSVEQWAEFAHALGYSGITPDNFLTMEAQAYMRHIAEQHFGTHIRINTPRQLTLELEQGPGRVVPPELVLNRIIQRAGLESSPSVHQLVALEV